MRAFVYGDGAGWLVDKPETNPFEVEQQLVDAVQRRFEVLIDTGREDRIEALSEGLLEAVRQVIEAWKAKCEQ